MLKTKDIITSIETNESRSWLAHNKKKDHARRIENANKIWIV